MKTYPQSPRLTIGKSEISPFAGCSDGDIFRTEDGKRWQLYSMGGGNWTLRPEGDRLEPALKGFENLDGWFGLQRAINDAAINGLPQ